MVILLNGAFGIGKTTVARLLRKRLRRCALFDPEWIGFVLQRMPRFAPPRYCATGDFQDVPAWRTLTVTGLRATRALVPNVVVPMTFSNLDYLDEVRHGVLRFDRDVRHFCLTAPLAVVEGRLAERGEAPGAWCYRRAAECCAAHRASAFDERVATEHRAPADVAAELLARIALPS